MSSISNSWSIGEKIYEIFVTRSSLYYYIFDIFFLSKHKDTFISLNIHKHKNYFAKLSR